MPTPLAKAPYLTREEANERLRTLGFHFQGPDQVLLGDTPEQRTKMVALEELLAGAIADWAEPEPEPGDDLVAELQEWTEEWLVG
jgi:hypothetical protein